MRLKGIIFDGDGVLFDTEKLHVLAWKRFLPFLKEEDFAEGVGVEDNIFLKRLKEKGKIRKQSKIDELVERKNKE
ncbi:MAG: beta-phosphoglucomutase, partial [Candidatus Ratteibacteria bacterium]